MRRIIKESANDKIIAKISIEIYDEGVVEGWVSVPNKQWWIGDIAVEGNYSGNKKFFKWLFEHNAKFTKEGELLVDVSIDEIGKNY